MTERHSDGQIEEKDVPAVPAPTAKDLADRKRRIMWIAVGSVTAVIVLFWVLLLPLQIKEFKFGSMSDLKDRWRVVRQESQPPTSFRETLNRLHDRLLESSARDQASLAAPAAAVPAVDVARLREKLEEISENPITAPANAPPQAQGTK